MRLFPVVAMLALAACPPSKAPGGAGGGFAVTLPSAAYDDHSDVPSDVKAKCKFHEGLPKAIADVTPGATMLKGSSSRVLDLVISSMRGVDAAWEGETSVVVRGELRESGTLAGSFRIRYSASAGLMGGLRGKCQALAEIAELMAEEIGPWMLDPGPSSKLGE